MTKDESSKTDQTQIDISLTFDPSQMSYGEIKAGLVERFERVFYTLMSTRHKGNLSAAAKELKMDRKHLHDMGKKHGLR
jgi:DNA-binding NtrC family response regulator